MDIKTILRIIIIFGGPFLFIIVFIKLCDIRGSIKPKKKKKYSEPAQGFIDYFQNIFSFVLIAVVWIICFKLASLL